MTFYLKQIFSQAGAELVSAILSLFEIKSNSVLLDCGCGDGTFLQNLLKTLGERAIIHGIEIEDEHCKRAREKGIFVHQDDLNKGISLESNSVDIILSHQVIEHLYDTDKFVSEVYRVLKPAGYAIITTENLASWHNIFSLLIGWQPFSLSNISTLGPAIGNPLSLHRRENSSPFSGGVPKPMQHSRIFTARGLKEIFEIYGFKCERLKGAGYYPLPGIISKFMTGIDVRHSAFLILKVRKPN